MSSFSYGFAVLHINVDAMSRNKKNCHNIAGPGNFTNCKTYKIFDGRELIPDMRSLFLTLEMITFSS
jgi:hypothetical protein